jgi:transposase-like protein
MARKKKSPADVVIDELGVRPLARTLKISPSTVARWRELPGGNVPSVYHVRLLELGKGALTEKDGRR